MRFLAGFALALALAGPAAAATANPAAGRAVFRAECGRCHTFAAAGTKARGAAPGPTLDGLRERPARVLAELDGSAGGLMPTFVGVLSGKQIADVVAFVVQGSKLQAAKPVPTAKTKHAKRPAKTRR